MREIYLFRDLQKYGLSVTDKILKNGYIEV